VGKETLPVERVRMSKDVEQSEETVTEKVRKERIEADADSDAHLRPQGR
jgi:stress response protein YsnF